MIVSRHIRFGARRTSACLSTRRFSDKASSSNPDEDLSTQSESKESTNVTTDIKEDKKAAAKKALFDLLSSVAKPSSAATTTTTTTSSHKLKLTSEAAKMILKDAKSSSESSSSSSSSSSSEESEAEDEKSFDDISEEAKLAAKHVANSYGGDVEKTELELLTSFRSHTSAQSKISLENLNSIISGMEVDTHREPAGQFRRSTWSSDSESGDLQSQRQPWGSGQDSLRRFQDRARYENINVFSGSPLNIFPPDAGKAKPLSYLSTWESCRLREVELLEAGVPRNGFEERIQWTKEGKLWAFPIDNEVGLEKEKSVKFHEHIFLTKHYASWCPKKGPLKHFMDLVATGLSKNPYITVERKVAHIEWYRKYFEDKQALMKDIGVIDKDLGSSSAKSLR